ncbi:hypothetical protein [Candidatus Sulfurimonas baltica]|uniref:Uncharacterized protein n=1 Tax=Candidatus Sulfurimonas baltica TaxID=2740404 RepID=A0A7S7RNY7_9BACT|nr:hypothetical protein [Candidatus Sulfurimonas baltica]QOY53036.1 hypothetical protein HUE88_04965 [Candidatus Sulfurimonas baltica]
MNFQEETANEIATNNTTESTLTSTTNIATAPSITAEYLVQQIVDFTQYQLLNNIHTGPRLSSKGIFQLFSNMMLPKTISSQLRKELEAQGLISAANGNIPFFKISEEDIALVYFGKFDGDSYVVPNLHIDTIEPEHHNMYQTLYNKNNEEKKSSIWKDKMIELGLNEVEISNDGSNICIVGQPIEGLDEVMFDFPPITDSLPNGAYLINYKGSPRFYVENRYALLHTLHNLSFMSVDIGPFFYQTFEGGIPVQEELDNNKKNIPEDPEWENIQKGSFFTGDSEDRWFEISTVVAYIHSLKTGVYQKYSNLTELNGKDFFIMRQYLHEGPEQTEEDIKNALTNIFTYLHTVNDKDILEFMRDDLKMYTPVFFEKYIDENIDTALTTL